jgi:DNA-binding MarR family transcriptional regulator
MTGRIDRLEKRGMVVRVPAPTDRRSLLVRLTAFGLRTAFDLRDELCRNSAFDLAVEELSQQDLAELNRRLRHLDLLLERRPASPPSGEQGDQPRSAP